MLFIPRNFIHIKCSGELERLSENQGGITIPCEFLPFYFDL